TDTLMEFWTTALGYQPKDPPEGFDDWCSYFRSIGVPEEELGGTCTVYLVDPEGVAPQVFLQEVPEPKGVKNRIHLDLRVGGGLEVPVAVRRQRVEAVADRVGRAGGAGPGAYRERGGAGPLLRGDAGPGGRRVLPELIRQTARFPTYLPSLLLSL